MPFDLAPDRWREAAFKIDGKPDLETPLSNVFEQSLGAKIGIDR